MSSTVEDAETKRPALKAVASSGNGARTPPRNVAAAQGEPAPVPPSRPKPKFKTPDIVISMNVLRALKRFHQGQLDQAEFLGDVYSSIRQRQTVDVISELIRAKKEVADGQA